MRIPPALGSTQANPRASDLTSLVGLWPILKLPTAFLLDSKALSGGQMGTYCPASGTLWIIFQGQGHRVTDWHALSPWCGQPSSYLHALSIFAPRTFMSLSSSVSVLLWSKRWE